MRIGISGGEGRMGRECIRAAEDEHDTVVFSVDPRGKTKRFADIPANLKCDCVVDFSVPEAVFDLLLYCTENKIPAVLATTGYTKEQFDAIKKASETVPILHSRNMSLCVNLMGRVCRMLAGALSPCECEIVETHHADKADAPSGTALYLADRVREGSGNGKFVYDRRISGKRGPGEIGVHSLRGGSVVGRHEVFFFAAGETLSIGHIAEDRQLFARGALAAARFLNCREPGLYSMDDLAKTLFGV